MLGVTRLAFIVVATAVVSLLDGSGAETELNVDLLEEDVRKCPAQIRVVSCEGDVARLTCPPDTLIQIVEANYGRKDLLTCCTQQQHGNQTCGDSRKSLGVVNHLCDKQRHCVVTATNGVFGDPCRGTYKYLDVTYRCVQAFSVITCEHGLARLTCPNGTIIQPVSARYGRTEFHPCPHRARSNLACGSLSKSQGVLLSKCGKRQLCGILASNSVFGDPCFGTFKYLEAVWTCVEGVPLPPPPTVNTSTPPPPPLLPRVNSKLVCEHRQLTLSCPPGKIILVKGAVYGRSRFETCPHPARSNLRCKASNSVSIVQKKCDKQRRCTVRASNSVFGDPCVGTFKYLEAKWTCVVGSPPPPPPAVNSKLVCEHKPLTLSCPPGKIILLKDAAYGRTRFETCPHSARSNLRCKASNSVSIVQKKCNKQQSCTVYASNGVFGDPCVGTFKYLEAKWTCAVGTPPPPLPSVFNRLVCEHKSLTLSCPPGKIILLKNAAYGRTRLETCPHPARSNLRCRASSSVSIVQKKCNRQRTCTVRASNSVFGDPCVGTFKYLEAKWTCVVGTPPPTFYTKLACEHQRLSLSCSYNRKIKIVSAAYGRNRFAVCPHQARSNLRCRSSKSIGVVSGACKGRSSCSVRASNSVFGDPCVGTFKYLEVKYICT